MGGVDLPFL